MWYHFDWLIRKCAVQKLSTNIIYTLISYSHVKISRGSITWNGFDLQTNRSHNGAKWQRLKPLRYCHCELFFCCCSCPIAPIHTKMCDEISYLWKMKEKTPSTAFAFAETNGDNDRQRCYPVFFFFVLLVQFSISCCCRRKHTFSICVYVFRWAGSRARSSLYVHVVQISIALQTVSITDIFKNNPAWISLFKISIDSNKVSVYTLKAAEIV